MTHRSASPLTLTPGQRRPGAGANVDPALTYRAGEGYWDWLDHVWPAAGCTRPIQLRGTLTTLDPLTGEVTGTRHTSTMPDGVIYKACGNRRHSMCPSCADVYRRDAYQLIRAGLVGGKTIDESVATHPALFGTFTAPSFGPVHSRAVKRHTCGNKTRCRCRPEPCHARRDAGSCAHGMPRSCTQRHAVDDMALGHPLCLDCYDHDHQVVWNNQVNELWRRTLETLTRAVPGLAREHGVPFLEVASAPGETSELCTVRVRYAKVAEYQARGVVHYHVLFRLDGLDPYHPDQLVPPPAEATAELLTAIVEQAATSTSFRTTGHPEYRPDGWPIGWGAQLDLRPVALRGDDTMTDGQVAAYLAKYATKSTETTGHVSSRLTADTIADYADPHGSHPQRLVDACWRISDHPAWRNLGKWAHMLGYGGHFLTKAHHYSVSLGYLRGLRVTWQRLQKPGPAAVRIIDHLDDGTPLLVTDLVYAGTGWNTTADATLANTAAALARARARAARDALDDAIDTYVSTPAETS